MEGVRYLTDEQNRKTAVVIDLEVLEAYSENLEDLRDGILAEARAGEERVSLDDVVARLKAMGKLPA